MNATTHGVLKPSLLTALRDFIHAGFSEEELRMMLWEALNRFDYQKYQKGENYQLRLFNILMWIESNLSPDMVILVAREALKRRGQQPSLADQKRALVAELPAGAGGGDLRKSLPEPDGRALPTDLTRLLMMLEVETGSAPVVARELRAILQPEHSLHFELNAQLHLSHLEGDRLGAVLWLERWPRAEYVWWLAERVTVESPAVGFLAAQALIAAALRLDRADLPRVRAAAFRSSDRLVFQMKTDASDLVAPGPRLVASKSLEFDAVSRKREVDIAITIVDIRSVVRPGVMTPEDLDRFLAAMQIDFTRNQLDALGDALTFPLRRFARADDTVPCCLAYLICRAREGRWEAELLEEVRRMKSDNPIYQDIYGRYH
jgi:hypothetical protein